MNAPNPADKHFRIAAALAALAAFVPFIRMVLAGQSLYFRDLSGQFFPARRFVLEGLAQGEFRFWNPLVHEGVPLTTSPFGYLPDLLQLLAPSEFGISLFLVLHLPLAAVAFVLLARELGVSPAGAAAGAVVYSLGGFSLSTLNFYVYTQALAWAPFFILYFHRALNVGSGRSIAICSAMLAVTISTTGLEIALQSCLLAVVVAPPHTRARFLRAAACALLGVALAAVSVAPLLAITGDSERGSGFATSVVLAHSIHPLTLFQVLIAGLYGDTSNITGRWWGVNFFPRGFPYMLSLYLGAAALALAGAGTMTDRPLRRRLFLIGLVALVAGLGRYVGWEAFFDLSPSLRSLRYPVKTFFTVQFCVALLAAYGVAGIASAHKPFLKRVILFSVILGGLLLAIPLVPTLAPQPTTWFLAGLLPASVPPVQRDLIGAFIGRDAALGGVVAVLVGFVCLLVSKERLAPSRASALVVALLAADLLRAGAGLNASVGADFYQLSPEMARETARLRQETGRVFTCDVESSPSYWRGRRARSPHHEAFTMATLQETLTPDFNVPFGVRTALSIDRTMLVPTYRVLSPELARCAPFDRIAPALRAAGVTRVVSLEPRSEKGLTLLSEVAPERIAPLRIRIYELEGALPRFNRTVTILRDTPDDLHLRVQATEPGPLLIREAFAPGWRARISGVEAPLRRTPEGHREIPLPRGVSEVQMSYEPSSLRVGGAITLLALVVWFVLFVGKEVRRLVQPDAPQTLNHPDGRV